MSRLIQCYCGHAFLKEGNLYLDIEDGSATQGTYVNVCPSCRTNLSMLSNKSRNNIDSYYDDYFEDYGYLYHRQRAGNSYPVSKEAKFKTDIKHITSCGFYENEPKIYIDPTIYEFLHKAAKEISTEWIAFLIGEKKDEDYYVTDVHFANHTGTTGTAEFDHEKLIEQMPENAIGTVHSHHRMGAFWSQTDHTYLLRNYDVNIVVAHNEEKGAIRVKLPCGAYKIFDDVDIKIVSVVDEELINNKLAILKETLNNTSQVKVKQTTKSIKKEKGKNNESNGRKTKNRRKKFGFFD